MPDVLTAQPCPVCADGHALSSYQVGQHTIYRCEATGTEFIEEEDLPYAEDLIAGETADVPIPEKAEESTPSGQYPSPSTSVPLDYTHRGSVVSYLKSAMSEPVRQDASPVILQDKYEVIEVIAKGGMGNVLLVEDNDLNRRVAMKTILPKFLGSAQYISRFIQEAQMIGQLEHPNIVPVYDVGLEDDGGVFFTMKYVRGQTLEEIITELRTGNPAAHRHYTWTRRAQIIQDICDALSFAHRRQVVHRDLKPANIMIGKFGEVQVMDWGVAKQLSLNPKAVLPQDGSASISDLKLSVIKPSETKNGSLVGTAYYMSPEQATGESGAITTASDLYSLGAIMYELFTLEKPHQGKNVYEVLASVIRDQPANMTTVKAVEQGTVPLEIEYIGRKAMAKEPGDRIESAELLKAELQLYLDGNYPIVCPHTALKRASTSFTHLIDNHAKAIIMSIVMVIVGLLFAAVVLTAILVT